MHDAWTSATTSTWSKGDRLDNLLFVHKPDVVIVALGANEVTVGSEYNVAHSTDGATSWTWTPTKFVPMSYSVAVSPITPRPCSGASRSLPVRYWRVCFGCPTNAPGTEC